MDKKQGIADPLEVVKAGFYYHRMMEGFIVASINAWCLPEEDGKCQQTVILPTEYTGQREVRTFFYYNIR